MFHRFPTRAGVRFQLIPGQVKVKASDATQAACIQRGPEQAKKITTPRLASVFKFACYSFGQKPIGLIPYFPEL
jgi:hypothetical protein